MVRGKFPLFSPIVAGATFRDRSVACLGSLIGIAITAGLSILVLGLHSGLPVIVAPMGASAVLLFAVPSSPMAQPWPLVGGNTISALVGVAVAQTDLPLAVAASLAVCLAILAMSLSRSLHPPGGAAALTAVIGGQAVSDMGFLFPFVPVALNAGVLLIAGWTFHLVSGHRYPHRPTPAGAYKTSDAPARLRSVVTAEDVDGALKAVGESFDIGRDDLVRLLSEVEWRAFVRTGGRIACADVMSGDVVRATADLPASDAQALLIRHNIRMLPVTDATGRLLGSVGLRQLLSATGVIGDVMVPATVVRPDETVADILPRLASEEHHGAIVIDEEKMVLGVITQTDVLAAMARAEIDEPSMPRLRAA